MCSLPPASGTLRRDTDEIDKVRRALGNRCVGVFDRMPAHTPRTAVIAATEQARAARADLIVTIGGGSITDGAKAVQLRLANDVRTPEALDALRPVNGATSPCNAPSVRQVTVPTTLSAGEFSAIAGVTDERHKVKELFRHPRIIPRAVILDPAITGSRRSGCSCPLASARWITASRASARTRRIRSPMRRHCADLRCWRGDCRG